MRPAQRQLHPPSHSVCPTRPTQRASPKTRPPPNPNHRHRRVPPIDSGHPRSRTLGASPKTRPPQRPPHYHPALEDRNDRVYCCYFHAGLRVYDIADPFVPREIAYFIPPDPEKHAFNNAAGDLFPGPNIATTEDVLVDNRGFIYMDTMQQGLFVLRCTV